MDVSPDIFRAYDVRGVFNAELTIEAATRIGVAFGTYLHQQDASGTITIARDARVSSPHLERAVATGIAATGYDVEMLGRIPIPVANFQTWQGDYAGGVYITASHNPAPYNGIRFRHPDGTGYTNGNTEIKRIYFEGELHRPAWDALGRLSRTPEQEVLDAYAAFVQPRFTRLDGLRVALDPGNGVATVIIQRLFRELGAEVTAIHEEPDGTFPNRPSEPAAKNLGALRELVRDGDYAFGVGYDGDGDRCVFIDDQGEAVSAEKIGILLARDILQAGPGNIVAGVPCSMILEDEIPKLGGKLIRVRVGDVYVCEEMKRHGALLAMEISAHYFAPAISEYLFDDPMVVSLKLAEILHTSGTQLSAESAAIASLPYEELKFEIPDAVKFKVNDWLLEEFTARGFRVETIDGVKIWLDDGCVLLRPSNTKPAIRMFVEARTPERLTPIRAEFEAELENAVTACS